METVKIEPPKKPTGYYAINNYYVNEKQVVVNFVHTEDEKLVCRFVFDKGHISSLALGELWLLINESYPEAQNKIGELNTLRGIVNAT